MIGQNGTNAGNPYTKQTSNRLSNGTGTVEDLQFPFILRCIFSSTSS